MWVLEYLVLSYFIFVVSYSITFSIAGLFYKPPSFILPQNSISNRIAILIPAYKEDRVIINTAKEALKQSYPKSNFDVFVIADSLQPETVDELKKLDVIVNEVDFEISTKVKSLQSILNTYENYRIAVILDADNIMENDFLEKINSCFNNGWNAIQGRRIAKNRNTSFAILDGLSEVIANHINRQGAVALGLSSPLIGSGMAFNFIMLRDIMNTIDSVVEDKELQIKILQRNEKIIYLNNAIVLDEKVSDPKVFENQRKRWISGHYSYFKKIFLLGMKSLFAGELSIFNITILLNIQLPRVMNLGLLFICTILFFILNKFMYIPYEYWFCLFMLYALSFFLAIPLNYYNRAFFKALLKAPKAFLIVFLLHFKLKGASKKFIHTPHGQ
jgi:cellulose synthase/poly-beta-1,6-N-acetylglucosamine synthase-like glycosyltransferase